MGDCFGYDVVAGLVAHPELIVRAIVSLQEIITTLSLTRSLCAPSPCVPRELSHFANKPKADHNQHAPSGGAVCQTIMILKSFTNCNKDFQGHNMQNGHLAVRHCFQSPQRFGDPHCLTGSCDADCSVAAK